MPNVQIFKIKEDNGLWTIVDNKGEALYCIYLVGWVGHKANLPIRAQKNKKAKIEPILFGFYDKYRAKKLCDELNEKGPNNYFDF